MTDLEDYWTDPFDDSNLYPYDEEDFSYDDDWVKEIAEAEEQYASASLDSYE